MKKQLVRFMLIVSVISAAVGLSSCDDDDTAERWYLNGTWQCMQYPDETLCFFLDGTGHWENNYTGDYEDFTYYCDDNFLQFHWYPAYGPSYFENCSIYMTNSNAMQITFPGRDGYGPQTLYYSRID